MLLKKNIIILKKITLHCINHLFPHLYNIFRLFGWEKTTESPATVAPRTAKMIAPTTTTTTEEPSTTTEAAATTEVCGVTLTYITK